MSIICPWLMRERQFQHKVWIGEAWSELREASEMKGLRFRIQARTMKKNMTKQGRKQWEQGSYYDKCWDKVKNKSRLLTALG